ncbi:MAG: GDP-mannose 4,6-dehydratase [Phycisphaerales bacterium]|nr:GDP-mannose 4,6-dehydratase [Phycisphaerales bacterium]
MGNNPDKETVLVTGAAGFIGSHLCEALLAAGRIVIGLDNFDSFYDSKVKRRNITDCLRHSSFSLVEGDIRDTEVVDRVLSGSVGTIVHLAARAGVRPSIENPLLYQDVNVNGTCVLLEAARRHGNRRFIFASSSSVYGNNNKTPFSESDFVDHPISPYAATKKAGELLCHAYHHLFGIHVTCLRFFTVYGARQRPDLAIHKFTRLIESGKPIPVFGDGSMMRDHTYIDDVIAGGLAAIDRCEGFRIYNLGESQPVSLSAMISAIERALGKKATIDRLPCPPGDVDRTYADVSRARAELGYEPTTDLDTGLRKFVAWFRGQQD